MYLPGSDRTRCYDLRFFECWVLSQIFHSPLSLSSRGFSVLHFLPLSVVSSAYLSLLIFLLAILIPACVSSTPAFLMMYSAYKIIKQGDNIQPWHIPSRIWNQSVIPCPVLTVSSWPAYNYSWDRWGGLVFPSLRISHSLLWPTQSKALA